MTAPTAPTAGSEDRAPEVREMFERLAPRYDLANRVLSLGLDQRWRRQAIAALGPLEGKVLIDLCAGTMDLTAMLLAAGAEHVHAMDFSESMLAAGSTKLAEGAPVTVTPADARALPLPDDSVDGIIAGFGLRNVPGVEASVAECARVLRPGGRLVVLDFFTPEGAVPRALQASYNKLVVPVVGGVITGFSDAYRYLADSIDAFATRRAFEGLLREHGFEARSWDLLPPVASIVTGTLREGGEDA
ncbi:MAG: ubiquinone/menaquinone biosynthesis methyltransferase [Alphaproteobacteria bacterium]|nr:ubiquinone/menaquinone biosynthesis methyltransferase [Alphaproteobacteria bacterium]